MIKGKALRNRLIWLKARYFVCFGMDIARNAIFQPIALY